MKKIITVLLLVFVILLVAVKVSVPLLLDKGIQKKVAATGYEVTYDKITFSLLRLDVGFKNLSVKMRRKKKAAELLSAESLTVKRLDLLNGMRPRYMSLQYSGLFYAPFNGYMAEFCSLIENSRVRNQLPLDGEIVLSFRPEDSLLLVEEFAVESERIGSFKLSGKVGAFAPGKWKSADLHNFSLAYVGEKQVQHLLDSEMKKEGFVERKEFSHELAKSVGFTLFADNLSREYLGLTTLKRDEAKREKVRRQILDFVAGGKGVSLTMRVEKGKMPIKLGRVMGLPLKRYAKVMEYELEIL